MGFLKQPPLLLGVVVFLLLIRRVHAFGAGNIAGISKVEGQNWRHGDIEDTLLQLLMARAVGGKKFDKLSVSRVYFGNWLRDYSQAIDVGTVKSVSAEAIRLLLCILGFLTFGYGSGEFEVTADRLGCYRPEDHIDNPKDYADNIDARQYDRRLRGPIDERVELAVDEATGMKNYIANENVNIMTSALHVRKLFGRCIELGRNYRRNDNKDDFYEALRLMGTGLHCLEDYLAHSNYTELTLIELGERDIFPHVGRNTQLRIEGSNDNVYPIVTGTFGGVDFLHSVTGEVSDKMTQNEIQELEGTLQNSQNTDTSMLRNLLDMIPDGLFSSGDKKQKMDEIQSNASAAQMGQMSVSPREPEEYTMYIKGIFDQIMPAIEFHDDILQSINQAIEKIPVLPKIVEQLEDQLSVFVFSVIAPFVVPVIQQIQSELQTGSSEIIKSSENEQHIVFNDDDSSNPTHSMLSKDHFSNILNEIAGRTASKVVAWVVPQLMEAWDDDNADVDRIMNRIIYGVLHHPAQREMGDDGAGDGRAIMFQAVEEWWRDMSDEQRDDYRRKLSRDGVQNGENHKDGVYDTGHGCGKPLNMHKNYGGSGGDTLEDRIATAAAGAIIGGVTSSLAGLVPQSGGDNGGQYGESQSGGLGGLLGTVLGGGNSSGGGYRSANESSYRSRGEEDNSYGESQNQYSRNDDGNGYGREEQSSGHSYENRSEERSENRWDNGEGRHHREEREEYREERRDEGGYEGGGGYGGGGRGYREERYEERREDRYEERRGEHYEERREEYHGYGGGEERSGWGGGGEERREEEEGGGWGRGGGRDEYGEEGGYREERRDDRGGWGF